jgi:hypothetical protein
MQLDDALMEIPEPPCTGCANFDQCEKRVPAVACTEFAIYVSPGFLKYSPQRAELIDRIGRRTPREWIFKHVFRDDGVAVA